MLRTGLQRVGAAIPRSTQRMAPSSSLTFQPLSRRPFTSPPLSKPISRVARTPAASSPGTGFTFSAHPHPHLRPSQQSVVQRLQASLRTRNLHTSRSRRDGNGAKGNGKGNGGGQTNASGGGGGKPAEAEPQTLGARMKKLTREYGWSALGVYFLLTAVDLPICYWLVGLMGVERVAHWEHVIVSHVTAVIPESVKTFWHEWRAAMKQAEKDVPGGEQMNEGAEMAGWGVQEAEEANKSAASWGTQLALAYAIHKSFIFIRVPLTIALTPRLVKLLRGWGWDIGKRTTKEAKAVKRAALPPKKKRKWRKNRGGDDKKA